MRREERDLEDIGKKRRGKKTVLRVISREREARQRFLRSWKKRFRNCNRGATSSFPTEMLPLKASARWEEKGKEGREEETYTNTDNPPRNRLACEKGLDLGFP